MLAIDIIDNGPGLPKHNRARLLEPYVTTKTKGTGLGLAVVKKIADEHGARLGLAVRPLGRRDAHRRGGRGLPPGRMTPVEIRHVSVSSMNTRAVLSSTRRDSP